MVEHRFDRPVGEQELRRGLWPDARNARNIVRAVPHQPLQVDQAERREAVLLLERRRIVAACVADALFRQQHVESRADELERVAVARHDDRRRPRCRRLRPERADDVVRLVVVELDEGNAEARRELLQQGNLLNQLLGRLVPRALVVGVQRRAERRAALVERDDDLRGRVLLQEFHEHHRRAVNRVRMDAVGVRRELQRVERTEKETAPVDDCKFFRHLSRTSCSSRRMRRKM